MHPESAGGTAQLSGPTPDCNSFPKGNAFSSPVQTGTDTQAVLAAPASAAVPARRRAVPARGESALPAAAWLFTVRTPAWRGPRQLGTPGSCGGTARQPPAPKKSPPSPRVDTQTQGTPSIPTTKKGLHWGRQCSLRARLPWAFPVPPSCPQGSRTAYRTAPGWETPCPAPGR